MMKNYDHSAEINQNPNWPYIPVHPHRILITGGSGSCKIIVLLNLMKNQRPDNDKIYFCIKDLLKLKYQLLIDGRGKEEIKKLKNSKAFLDYSHTVDNVYKSLED